jgi:hypothetical protein
MVSEETPLRLADLCIPERARSDNGDNHAPVSFDDATIAQLWGWDRWVVTPSFSSLTDTCIVTS